MARIYRGSSDVHIVIDPYPKRTTLGQAITGCGKRIPLRITQFVNSPAWTLVTCAKCIEKMEKEIDENFRQSYVVGWGEDA